ncbi:MAG: DUF3795 domain-containing protein [candidate division WOR-3 bacterium]|nr:MAG: DUF3795 domain-containing protein [candidate division WOR-3 bacterium]
MNYEQEKKMHISYCGSYCHLCDWHTGKIRKAAQSMLDLTDEQGGFKRLLNGKANIDDFRTGLEIIAQSSICSGCKAELTANERCQIRKCCSSRGFDLCSECSEFPCETLKTNPGVIKFRCIENLEEIEKIGLEQWIDKQWADYTGYSK